MRLQIQRLWIQTMQEKASYSTKTANLRFMTRRTTRALKRTKAHTLSPAASLPWKAQSWTTTKKKRSQAQVLSTLKAASHSLLSITTTTSPTRTNLFL